MTATDAQVRIMMREREKGRTQEQAAVSANLSSRKTAAKYERLGQLPSELKQPRTQQHPGNRMTEPRSQLFSVEIRELQSECDAFFSR